MKQSIVKFKVVGARLQMPILWQKLYKQGFSSSSDMGGME